MGDSTLSKLLFLFKFAYLLSKKVFKVQKVELPSQHDSLIMILPGTHSPAPPRSSYYLSNSEEMFYFALCSQIK